MHERNPTHPEQAPHEPKTQAEHRAEFIQKYHELLSGEATWVEEDGREVEGRVYDVTVDRDKSMSTSRLTSDISDIVKFRLKARQAGYKVVDRIELPGGGDEVTSPFTTHQFYLEGSPLPTTSSQESNLTDSSPTS